MLLGFIFMSVSCTAGKSGSVNTSTPTLVCLGNSLTAGYGAAIPGEDDRDKSFPAFLQTKISIPVINAGVSGDTAEEGLSRVKNEVLSQNPGIVIIELGANDLFQEIPIEVTQANLQSIINMINNGSRKIYLAKFYSKSMVRMMLSMLQISDYDKQTVLIEQYDAMFSTLAASKNIELIGDIWAGLSEKHMSDGTHPNAEGYKIMADNYFKALKPHLEANGLLK